MECPRCANTDTRTVKTLRHPTGDVRLHMCEPREANKETTGCGLLFKSKARISEVQVFNKRTKQAEFITLDTYRDKHLDYELGYKTENLRMFNDPE